MCIHDVCAIAYLDDNFHKVFLGNDILAAHDLLQDAGQDNLLIHVEVYAIELAQTDEVRANKYAQLFALQLALFTVTRVPLML